MADRGQVGTVRNAARLRARRGRSIVYTDGAYSVTVVATLGAKLLNVMDETGGTRIVVTDRDYIVSAADLILNGVAVKPAKGAKITDAGDPDGVTRTWEVLPPADGEEHFQWADPYRVNYRVHAKLVRGAA